MLANVYASAIDIRAEVTNKIELTVVTRRRTENGYSAELNLRIYIPRSEAAYVRDSLADVVTTLSPLVRDLIESESEPNSL